MKTRTKTPLVHVKQRRRISAQRYLRSQDIARDRFERRLERQLRSVLKTYGAEAAREYRDTSDFAVADSVLPVRLEAVLYPHYRRIIPVFGRMAFDMLEKQDDSFFRMIADQYIFTIGAVAITRASATVKGFVNALVSNGIAAGDSIETITTRIRRTLASGDFPRARARVIARTETHGAATFANHETAKSLDIPDLHKRWVAILGPRTRSTHNAMNGVTVPMDEPFNVPVRGGGTEPMDRPGDPSASAGNVIQCRCAVLYVERDDIVSP